MTKNQKIFQNLTAFGLQLTEVHASLMKAISNRLRPLVALDLGLLRTFQASPETWPSILSSSLARELERLAGDVESALLSICVRQASALSAFLNPGPVQAGEQLNVSAILDPFDLVDTGMDDENVFSIAAEFYGITEDEARELFAALLLFGLSIRQLLLNWIVRQRIDLQNRIASIIADNQVTSVDDGRIIQIGTGERIDGEIRNAIERTLLGDSRSALNSLSALTESAMFSTAGQMVGKLVTKNPQVFTGEYVWIAVLDSRTCKRCGALHGVYFTIVDGVPQGPIPGLHLLCRCMALPVVKDGGELPEKMDFVEWLKGRSKDTQDSILGKRGGELFRSGQVQFKDFVAFRGRFKPRERTMDEIERMF